MPGFPIFLSIPERVYSSRVQEDGRAKTGAQSETRVYRSRDLRFSLIFSMRISPSLVVDCADFCCPFLAKICQNPPEKVPKSPFSLVAFNYKNHRFAKLLNKIKWLYNINKTPYQNCCARHAALTLRESICISISIDPLRSIWTSGSVFEPVTA